MSPLNPPPLSDAQIAAVQAVIERALEDDVEFAERWEEITRAEEAAKKAAA